MPCFNPCCSPPPYGGLPARVARAITLASTATVWAISAISAARAKAPLGPSCLEKGLSLTEWGKAMLVPRAAFTVPAALFPEVTYFFL